MHRVIILRAHVLERYRGIQPRCERLVRKKALANDTVRLPRAFRIGIARRIPFDLASGGTREVHLAASLGEVPIGVRKLGEPEANVRAADDKEYFHCLSPVGWRFGVVIRMGRGAPAA